MRPILRYTARNSGPLSYDPALPTIIEAGLWSHLGNVGIVSSDAPITP